MELQLLYISLCGSWGGIELGSWGILDLGRDVDLPAGLITPIILSNPLRVKNAINVMIEALFLRLQALFERLDCWSSRGTRR